MADRRKNIGQIVDSMQETEHQFLDKHKVSATLKEVVTKLLANRPNDPLSFIVNYFRNITEDDQSEDLVKKTAKMITMTHHSRPVFETNLLAAYETLSTYKIAKRLHGVNGAVHKELLQILCRDLPGQVKERLFKKIECFENEAVAFAVFRSTVFTCCVLIDFFTLTKGLYSMLNIERRGKAEKHLCQTVLQQLRLSVSSEKTNVERLLESSYNFVDGLYIAIDKAMSNEYKESMTEDQFIVEGCDIFMSKVKQLR